MIKKFEKFVNENLNDDDDYYSFQPDYIRNDPFEKLLRKHEKNPNSVSVSEFYNSLLDNSTFKDNSFIFNYAIDNNLPIHQGIWGVIFEHNGNESLHMIWNYLHDSDCSMDRLGGGRSVGMITEEDGLILAVYINNRYGTNITNVVAGDSISGIG